MTTCAVSNSIEKKLRGIAGSFLILSVIMFHYHSVNWIWFILFIGINLFQSAFTNWCPMIMFLNKLFKIENKTT